MSVEYPENIMLFSCDFRYYTTTTAVTVAALFLEDHVFSEPTVVGKTTEEINLHAIQIFLDDFTLSVGDDLFDILFAIEISALEDLRLSGGDVNTYRAAKETAGFEQWKPRLEGFC